MRRSSGRTPGHCEATSRAHGGVPVRCASRRCADLRRIGREDPGVAYCTLVSSGDRGRLPFGFSVVYSHRRGSRSLFARPDFIIGRQITICSVRLIWEILGPRGIYPLSGGVSPVGGVPLSDGLHEVDLRFVMRTRGHSVGPLVSTFGDPV